MQIGLERISGQKDVYKNALRLLMKEIEKCTVDLNNYIAANDMHNFEIEAHSMKSSLANVGAMELSARAHELEVASSRNDTGFCAANLQIFSDELHDLAIGLTEAFSEIAQNTGPLIVSPGLALILARMKDSLREMKFLEINDELRNLDTLSLSGMLKDEIEEIKDAIIIMDYDSAIEKIQTLLDIHYSTVP
jgi:HPt (histidine-containing phosphotransfer) domain-containing protein